MSGRPGLSRHTMRVVDMDWMKIGSALLIGAMILYLWPRARQMMKETRKAEPGEWQSALLIFLAVAGFVVLLVMMVR